MRPDEAIRYFLDRQFGLITSDQAYESGLTPAALKHQVRTGRLLRVYRGVYRVPYAPRSPKQAALAANLACGEGAVTSHLASANLFGLIDRFPDIPEVTMPVGHVRRIPGIRVHRTRLAAYDHTHLGIIAITGIARTLVDTAGDLCERDLTEAADRGFRRKLISPDLLEKQVGQGRFDRFRGIAVLRRVVADRVKHGVPDSILESDMIELLREFRLPEPVRQHEVVVRGHSIHFDLAYPAHRFGIELDGKVPHTDYRTWQSDHRRHNATELDEWPTLRFTWWDVHNDRVYVAVTVADKLGLRPDRWRNVPRPAH